MTAVLDSETGREILLTEAFAYNGTYEVKATGFSGTATGGGSTNLDFAIGAEDRYINGCRFILKNHAASDSMGFKVVDIDNVLGYGAGTVLKTFGLDWNVDSERHDQGRDTFNFVARIYAGLYIRVVYVSTGLLDVSVKMNASLYKKVS